MDTQLIYVIFAQISHTNSYEVLKTFCSWTKVDIISYQGINSFYNVIILLYGNENDIRKPHPQIRKFGSVNRDKIKQIYRVCSNSRALVQNIIDNDIKQCIYSRNSISPYVFWYSFPKYSCHEVHLKTYQKDYNINLYEEDLKCFFPFLRKLFFNANHFMIMRPLLEEFTNENFYLFPFNFLSINNTNINYHNIIKKTSIHFQNYMQYKVEIHTNEKVNIESLIENLYVFIEQYMGLKSKMQVIYYKDQQVYILNILFSHSMQYLLCLHSILFSLKQSVNNSKFIINDLTCECNWNKIKEISFSTYKNNRMLVINYDNKVIFKRQNIYPKVSSTREIVGIESGNDVKKQIYNYLPYSAKLRYDRNNFKDEKEQEWHNTISSIPFGKYFTSNIKNSKKRTLDGIENLLHMENVSNSLCELSEDIYLSNLLNPKSPKKHILLSGPPGNGKTHYCINILPKILNNRPVCFISVAGIQDPHILLGHDFTYIGAKPGKIIQNIIDVQCLDPIIIFDEIDKADRKVQNVLVSLLDPLQSYAFKDLFLGNIPIDLSKSFFVMTSNSHSAEYISSPLLDRLFLIQVPSLSQIDQIKILKNVIFPKVVNGILTLDDYITKQLCDDEHVLKEVLKLSDDINTNDDGHTSSSLRCIEKTAYKVFLEFIKCTLKSLSQNYNNTDINSFLISDIKCKNKKIQLQNVITARESFQKNKNKNQILSHLYI